MANPGIRELARQVRLGPARLGGARLVLIDGPAGAGKSTLADRVGGALRAQVYHGDDMYEGWTGLPTLRDVLVEEVLAPLAEVRDGGFQRWDWENERRDERVDVQVADVIVIEGVGVAMREARRWATLVIYVDAPDDIRIARGLERDGEAYRPQWEAWMASEKGFLEDEGVRDAADVVIDGTAAVGD